MFQCCLALSDFCMANHYVTCNKSNYNLGDLTEQFDHMLKAGATKHKRRTPLNQMSAV